ncbi:MAG TPA: hypothetical protein VGO47_03110, partial [Chlamydiales bacterium]|nr:hypothetical protein [Chlamydiales bacterium]
KPMGLGDVCKHHCFTSSAAHRMRAAWDADWFVPDTQVCYIAIPLSSVSTLSSLKGDCCYEEASTAPKS